MTIRLAIILFSTVTSLFFSTCKLDKHDIKVIEGDLYFSWLRFGSFYNQPDSIIEKVKLYADTVNRKLVD